MNSTATPRFWQRLHELPAEVQALALKNYQLWLANPQHPSLNYKRLAGTGHRFSVRVGSGRAGAAAPPKLRPEQAQRGSGLSD